VLTVSDTRRGREDTGGALIEYTLRRAGHHVSDRVWVKDDVAAIRRAVKTALARSATDVVILTGGTGVAPRDVTPEALAPLVEKRLEGFGERFRARSWDQVGATAWLSRAFAGIASGRLVVALPGSLRAVELAMNELVVPGLVHVVRLLGRFQPEE